MNTQNKIEIKNIKISDFASEETTCFQASVYLDGERICTASNQGTGGGNFYLKVEDKTWEDVKQLKEIAKKQTGREFEPLDWLISELIEEYQVQQIVKKKQGKGFVYEKDDVIYTRNYHPRFDLNFLKKIPIGVSALRKVKVQLESEGYQILNTNLGFLDLEPAT